MRNIIVLSILITFSAFNSLYAQDDINSKDINTASFVLSRLVDQAGENGSYESAQAIVIYSNTFDMIKKKYLDSIDSGYITYFKELKINNSQKISGVSIYLDQNPRGIFINKQNPCPPNDNPKNKVKTNQKMKMKL